MAEWTQCPSCQLKHVARPDGLCPRCRHPIAAPVWGSVSAPAAPPAPSAQPASAGWPAAGIAAASPQQPGVAYPPPGVAYPVQPAGMTAAPYAFTVGRFISGAFGTWFRSAGFVVPIALALYAPMAVTMYWIYSHLPLGERVVNATNPLAFVATFAVVMILLMILSPVETVAIARAGVRRAQDEPLAFGDMLGTAFRQYFPAFGLLFVVGLAVLGTACTLFIVPAILLTGWAAALPAMITEGLGPIEALKRSWELTRGLRWQVFAGFLVVFLAVFAVSCVLQSVLSALVIGVAVGAGAGGRDPQALMGSMGVMQAANMLLQGVYSSIYTVATAVAYHQLRTASEGPAAQTLGNVFE